MEQPSVSTLSNPNTETQDENAATSHHSAVPQLGEHRPRWLRVHGTRGYARRVHDATHACLHGNSIEFWPDLASIEVFSTPRADPCACIHPAAARTVSDLDQDELGPVASDTQRPRP